MTTEPDSPPPVECSVTVEADPEVVFPFLTDPGRIVAWMGATATLDPEPGGIYRVELPVGYTIVGEFEEVTPPRRVVFSWGWEHEDALVAPGASRVEIDLDPVDGGTQVRLRHLGLGGEAAAQHRIGWLHYLGRLRVAAGGGDPGDDPGPQSETPRRRRP